MNNLKVVIVPVGEKPYVSTISDDLWTMQNLVGGLIEVIFLEDELFIVCDEEAKLKSKEGNRMVNGDIIAGDFFIIADGEDGEFKSLTEKQSSEMIERFLQPEAYTQEEVEDSISIAFISLA